MRGDMAIGGLIGRRDRSIGRGGETTVVLREHVVGALQVVVTEIFSLDYLLVGLVTLRTGHCHFHGTVANRPTHLARSSLSASRP